MTTTNLALSELAASQSQPHVTVNASLRMLDAVVQLSVTSTQESTPPGSPTDGQRYIVPGSGGTGAWAGHNNEITYWVAGASEWRFLDPKNGWLAFNELTNEYYKFSGGSPGGWAALSLGGSGNTDFTLTGGEYISAGAAYEFASLAIQASTYRWKFQQGDNAGDFVLKHYTDGAEGAYYYPLNFITVGGEIIEIDYGALGRSAQPIHYLIGNGVVSAWDGTDVSYAETGFMLAYIGGPISPSDYGVWALGMLAVADLTTIHYGTYNDIYSDRHDFMAAKRAGNSIASLLLGNTTDNPVIKFASRQTSAPSDTLADGECQLVVYDSGASQVLRVRYQDGGTTRVGDITLT